MTKEEIKNLSELIDLMLDKCILEDSRTKVFKRLKEVCDLAIKALEQEELCEALHEIPSNEMNLEQARQAVRDLRKCLLDNYLLPESGDAISRQAVLDMVEDMTDQFGNKHRVVTEGMISLLPPVTPKPKTGHWSRKTKVDAYDIAGVKTWGIKCQCDRCDFTTIVVEDFGYYKFCPNCGAKMVEPQERSE